MSMGCIITSCIVTYILILWTLCLTAFEYNWDYVLRNLLMVIFWPLSLIVLPFIGLFWLIKNRKDISKIIIRFFYA